jgi:hypothetical protein
VTIQPVSMSACALFDAWWLAQPGYAVLPDLLKC